MGLPIKIRIIEPRDWKWIQLRAQPLLCEDTQGFVAVRGEELLGAVVLDSFTSTCCLSHIVIENPMVLRHKLLEITCDFAFGANQLKLILGLTPADNAEALRFNKKVGFKEVYRIPEGYKPGVDYVLQELHHDACRWWKPNKLRAA